MHGALNKKFQGNGSNDTVYSVTMDSSDNFYVAGYGLNLVSGSSGEDWWIKKFTLSGIEDNAGWNKTINGNGTDDIAYECAVDSINNVYVVGYMHNGTDLDMCIKKFNSNGTEIISGWNKLLSNC